MDALPGTRHPFLPRRQLPGPGEVGGGQRVGPGGGGLVEGLDVVAHHAAGRDLRAERRQRRLDPLDPPAGHRSLGALVEQGDDLVLEQGEQAVGLDLVALGQLLDALGRRDGPPVVAVEHLVPPTVEDGAVE